MKSAESKSERTRQFIIEQTASIFNAKGYAGTSLSDLTEATGLTKGSIYGNFDNKDDVAIAAFVYNFGRVTAYLKEKMAAHENAVDRLLIYPKVYSDFLKIPFLKAGCPLLNTAIEADDTHPRLREHAIQALHFWKTSIENQIKRGIKRKEIREDVVPSEMAVVIMSIIEGAIMQAKLTGRPTDLKVAMRYLEKIITEIKN